MKVISLSVFLLLSFSLIAKAADVTSLEETSEEELRALLKEEKYILILFMKNADCSGDCLHKEKSLLNIREELAEAIGAWVLRSHAPAILKSWGGDASADSIVFVRDGNPMLYTGNTKDPDEFLNYLITNKDSNVRSLDDASFEHQTQASSGATTGDWMVIFVKDSCEECDQLLAHVETSAAALRNKKNVAIIHREKEAAVTTRRFGITSFPSVVLFRLGKVYRYPDIPTITASTLTAFAEEGFRNSKAEAIPLPKTPFDDVTQAIADWLRENPFQFLGGVVGVFVVILLLVLLNSPPPSSWTKQNKKKKKQ